MSFPPSHGQVETWYHRARVKLDLGLHKFVRSESDEAERFRRRLHIHVCLLCATTVLTLFSLAGTVSVYVVTSSSTGVLVVQEFIDSVGRF